MRFHFPLLAAISLLASASQAKESNSNTLIYAPLAGIQQNQSLFEPVLFAEKTPISFSSYLGDARSGGSGIAAHVLIPMFPFIDQENGKRSNGWSVGIASGIQRDALKANDIFVPGFHFLEAGVGRATTDSWSVAGTGLRGYLELAFRDQRSYQSSRQQNRLDLVSQIVPDDNYFLALRMGAATDNQGSGIVSQKPGFFSWAVQTAVYIPLKQKQGYADIKISPFTQCFGKNFLCGVNFYYMNLFKGTKTSSSEHANHFAMASTFLRYVTASGFSADLDLYESMTTSPLIKRGKAVYTNRSSFSIYPGAKLSLIYGF